ncbi:MAG: hypothetical protein WCT45_01225 [Candidatus Paceibacterota bacterium]|jgi:hypothetical protein
MSTRPIASVFAVLLTITLVAPTAFFVAPRQAEAMPVTVVGDIVGWIQETITAIATPISAAAGVAKTVNDYVLQPLAFVLSGNLMKMLTASVVQFVIGKANGTGVPQFVVDVKRSMQTVGDSQALAYLRQVGMTNSPFAGSISSALRNDYLTKTSLRGFWDANLCSLTASSPDVPAYLAGDWSRGGGIAAWFSLTTQTQNDPFSLFQHTQTQLAAVVGSGVGGATDVRAADISRNNGFMSWCGTSAETTAASEFAAGAAQTTAAAAPKPVECTPATEKFADAMGTCYASAADASAADQINNASETLARTGAGMTATGGVGVNPGDPCTNSDGTPGTIKTPGSVIKATFDKVLGGQQDQITRMGNVGPQITAILRDVASIINTVNFASSLLGGGDSGGLFGVNSTSASRSTSRLAEFAPNTTASGVVGSGYGGVTTAQIKQDGSTISMTGPGSSGYAQYTAAWNTISASVNEASTSVQALATLCITSANNAKGDYSIPASFIATARTQANIATTTLKSVVAPIQARILLAASTTEPTIAEIATVVQDAQAANSAMADPEGSLNIVAVPDTKMTTVDQMNLLSANAQALRAVCTPPTNIVNGG